jgi:nucleotide-binding universal stress UspA family protein
MASLQKILVPTDLSPSSRMALEKAHEFASAFGASIDLLYVWSAPALIAPESVLTGVGIDEQPLLEWAHRSALEQLSKFEAEVRGAGIPVQSSLCELGDPATNIVQQAASGKYQLLVMGTHGRTGLAHVLMGSVTEKVVRRASCPVLTVRTTEPA